MNDSDTEFIDKSLIENGGSKSNLLLSTSCLDIENHLSDPNTPTPIEAVVRISQPDSDSDDDVPLRSLQVPKADKEWKWKKCVFAEDGIVNIDLQDPSPDINLTLILMTMFHCAVCKFPKLIKNRSGKNVSLQKTV